MSSLLVAALKIAFLAAMWLFVFFVTQTIRTDMVGRTASAADLSAAAGKPTRKERRAAAEADALAAEADRAHPERRLLVIAGKKAGTSVPLSGDITIGRSADSTLDIEDDFASGRHATLWRDATGSWVVQDLHSTNGTYVNGFRIVDPTRIGIEDIIRIGRTQLKLER